MTSDSALVETAESNGSATRERIIRTATTLFAANGYDATGIAELIAAAGVSRGAFYYHIDSKQTLLFGPFDIEGHRGTDGRVYLLDFHRVFPPEPTVKMTLAVSEWPFASLTV